MAVLKINNNSYLFNNYNNRFINFGDGSLEKNNFESDISQQNKFNKLSDDELKFISSIEPDNRFSKISKNVLKTMVFAIPAVDIASSILLKNGNLSSKLKNSMKTAFIWTGVFAAGSVMSQIKKSVNSQSEFLDKADKNNPFFSSLVDFTALFAAFSGVLKLGEVIRNKFPKKFPKFTERFNNSVKQPVKTFLNNSTLNKKIIRPLENYLAQKPDLLHFRKTLGMLIVPVLFTSVLIRYLKEAKTRDIACSANYEFLKGLNELLPEQKSVE